jgi:hypothetical protein
MQSGQTQKKNEESKGADDPKDLIKA